MSPMRDIKSRTLICHSVVKMFVFITNAPEGFFYFEGH